MESERDAWLDGMNGFQNGVKAFRVSEICLQLRLQCVQIKGVHIFGKSDRERLTFAMVWI